jgi:hypothetical protein
MRKWGQRLEAPVSCHRTIEAIRSCLKDCVGPGHGSLTFKLVQVLSGMIVSNDSCTGLEADWIRAESPSHECSCDDDTAQHVLEFCPAWSVVSLQS